MTSGFARVTGAFNDLTRYQVKPDANAARDIGPAGRESHARLIKDQLGQVYLELAFDADRQRPPLSPSDLLPHVWVENTGEISMWLRITVAEPRLEPTFQALIGQTLEEASADRPLVDTFAEVLASWDEILRSLQNSLSSNAELGLFGELFLLREMAALDPQFALSSWRGSDNYRHDFVSTNAIEVKTYTSYDDAHVTIHGLHQLQPPQQGELLLVAIHVDRDEQGQKLAEIVEDLDSIGVPTGELLRRLNLTQNAIASGQNRYSVVDSRAFSVAPDFPGIRPERLEEEALVGVSRLQYRLNLADLSRFERSDFTPADTSDFLRGSDV